MVDRVYKARLPAFRKALEKLKEDFADIPSRTNWTKLRIEPLLRHVESLERVLESEEFSRESSRLTRGVVFFRSDLEYLRRNLKALEEIRRREKGSRTRRT